MASTKGRVDAAKASALASMAARPDFATSVMLPGLPSFRPIALRTAKASYAGIWVTRRSGGVVCRHVDDLDAVFKSDTCDDLRQLICAFQPPPGFRRGAEQLEHHQPGSR